MKNFEFEKKTINQQRINNFKTINKFCFFESYSKLPKNELFILEGCVEKNKNFSKMQIYCNKKTNSYIAMQGYKYCYLVEIN